VGEPERGIEIPVLFVGVEDVPVLLANQFVIQHQQEEFILMIGQVAPPLILAGTPEEQLEQAKNISYIPIKVVGRFGLTRTRMTELIRILQDNLKKFDEGKR
jgi:hypothetical protein